MGPPGYSRISALQVELLKKISGFPASASVSASAAAVLLGSLHNCCCLGLGRQGPGTQELEEQQPLHGLTAYRLWMFLISKFMFQLRLLVLQDAGVPHRCKQQHNTPPGCLLHNLLLVSH